MVSDLIESSLVGHPLEGLLFGGAPAPDSLVPRAREAFPTATMCVFHSSSENMPGGSTAPRIQGYGLTETNSIAVSVSQGPFSCMLVAKDSVLSAGIGRGLSGAAEKHREGVSRERNSHRPRRKGRGPGTGR
jgi:acyl-CoA synthetase (AMP-forming)/AMP-acid ligase II